MSAGIPVHHCADKVKMRVDFKGQGHTVHLSCQQCIHFILRHYRQHRLQHGVYRCVVSGIFGIVGHYHVNSPERVVLVTSGIRWPGIEYVIVKIVGSDTITLMVARITLRIRWPILGQLLTGCGVEGVYDLIKICLGMLCRILPDFNDVMNAAANNIENIALAARVFGRLMVSTFLFIGSSKARKL
jgi:hypothetical protein